MVQVTRQILNKSGTFDLKKYECADMVEATDLLDKLHKMDLGYYQRYVTKYSERINNCDDGYYHGISYYFVVDNVCVECEIVDATIWNDNCVFYPLSIS